MIDLCADCIDITLLLADAVDGLPFLDGVWNLEGEVFGKN
jgi:hypothetical protein|tara:strand:+ start:496 stop:615 length:120 start_codon:yes stop_codon:yes gene_type:complete